MSGSELSWRAFLVLSVHAYYLLEEKHVEISKKGFGIALIMAVFSLAPVVHGAPVCPWRI